MPKMFQDTKAITEDFTSLKNDLGKLKEELNKNGDGAVDVYRLRLLVDKINNDYADLMTLVNNLMCDDTDYSELIKTRKAMTRKVS